MLAEKFENVLNEKLVHHCFTTINVLVHIIFSPSVSICIYLFLAKQGGRIKGASREMFSFGNLISLTLTQEKRLRWLAAPPWIPG